LDSIHAVGCGQRAGEDMRIHFMLVRRVPPVPSPVLLEVFATLERRGFRVESSIAEEHLWRLDRLAPQHELHVLKSHTELSLSLAGVLHSQGALMLNPYLSCLAAQDKIVAFRRMDAAAIPVPRTWTAGDASLLPDLLHHGPLVVKPFRGHRGHGVRVLRDERDVAAMPPAGGPFVVQQFVEGTGEDLKVYVVGDRVSAVRKPFSADSFTRPGRPCPVSSEVRAIALRCGEAFGLGLYGLDLIEGPDGPVVVDLNYFPGYKGMPGPAPLIADYIDGFARGRLSLEPPPPIRANLERAGVSG
jgi:ribosomal protein S6--L-glutamate ligase